MKLFVIEVPFKHSNSFFSYYNCLWFPNIFYFCFVSSSLVHSICSIKENQNDGFWCLIVNFSRSSLGLERYELNRAYHLYKIIYHIFHIHPILKYHLYGNVMRTIIFQVKTNMPHASHVWQSLSSIFLFKFLFKEMYCILERNQRLSKLSQNRISTIVAAEEKCVFTHEPLLFLEPSFPFWLCSPDLGSCCLGL